MKCCRDLWVLLAVGLSCACVGAAPVIDPLPNVSIPAGKSLTIPITASSPNGRPLAFSITSSTNRIAVEQHTNNPFWKMSVVQAAPANAPGAFQTSFRGGLATVTNVGDMTFMLLRDRAPRTVDAIAGLTTSGFYNSNTIFHRVVLQPYFIIQGGDPNTNGSGGPVFNYDDELHLRSLFTGSGQLGSANSGADSSGSQFFITAAPQRGFDLRYTIFGQLLRGFNVMSNIINTPTNASSRPLADVIITRASLVPNYTDTVITLTGTNFAGVAGTISVIADDGTVGGRTTNTFIATTATDTFNDPPVLSNPPITNLFIPINGRVTNYVAASDIENNQIFYDVGPGDINAFLNSTSTYNETNGQFTVVPNPGYFGPLRFYVAISQNTIFNGYDYQEFNFAVGDTAIVTTSTNFIARPLFPFTNQILATFTNGIANSPTNNFLASINWGDNSVTLGNIVTNSSGRKEVRGTHTYTNSGHYPIYVRILSAFGAETTVVSTAYVQPSLDLTRTGTSNRLRWPAWATDYKLQSHTNLSTANWVTTTNLPSLSGYEIVVTNISTSSNGFFRLRR